MYLYNLTLQPASSISTAILGHFSGTKAQEIVVARNQKLELWQANTTTGKLSVEHSEDMFCRIRSLASFRVTGGSKDYIVMGADTGAACLMEYDFKNRRFKVVQYHEFGRTGLRRLVAGQYVATDPKGRAFMIGAVERSKLVYVVTRDSEARLVFGSPLEASKAHSICFDIVGVDVGYENPVFAALESVYDDDNDDGDENAQKKQVVYYELDLGLNHVVRKWAAAVPDTANRLIALPGGDDGPSGVLVCSEGAIEYYSPVVTSTEGLRVVIPRRTEQGEDRPVMIVTHAVHRMKNAFFILAQGETGDLYKVIVEYSEEAATQLGITYFDSIPPASCLRILRAGFLFAASADSGSHRLFQFENLGLETEPVNQQMLSLRELSSLILVDEVEGLCPILRSQVLNLAEEDTPQVYALCGRAAQSALRIVRHGLEVSELAVSELPGTPQAVWAVRRQGDFDDLIVVGFRDATLVLGVADDVTEVTNSGLLATEPTLALGVCDAGGIVQATPRVLRRVHADGRAAEWQPPRGLGITHAALNSRQAVVALGERAVVFELDTMGELRERAESLDAGTDIVCVGLPAVPQGRRGASFVAVGCADSTVRVFALGAGGEPELAAMQAVADAPESVALVQTPLGLMLFVGLRSGLLVRARVDEVTGELSDPRTRFLGACAVRLRPVTVRGGAGVVALSTQPWLCHVHQGRLRTIPLSYDALDDACAFVSPQSPEGMVSIAAGTLRIISVDRLDAEFNHASIPLSLTPREFLLHPESRHFAIIETEHGGASMPDKQSPEQFGLVRQGAGQWASALRIVNPFDGESTQTVEFTDNWAAISLAHVSFAGHSERYVAVGCVCAMTMRPRACESASIRIYRWNAEGTQLDLVHETPVDEIPQALLSFGGMLLVGLGRTLRLYDLGIRQLLKKAQTMVAPSLVTGLYAHPTAPQRLFVTDVQESVQLVVYSQSSRQFHVVLDDSLPRYITCAHVLEDGDTVVAGDKFGNLFVLRAPEAVSRALDADPAGTSRLVYDKPRLGASAHRWNAVCEFHAGDIVTSISTCSLAAGSRPVIFYTTLMGALQAAIPLPSQSDVDFFQALELNIRKHSPPISGRDHLKHRSSYNPVKAVIDGDLCEQYNMLPDDTRELISDNLDRTQQDISKRLEDLRAMFAY
ncbi:pre-mRNA-splicing factor rse1 [Coemansia sp. RSA 1722]|nr:pre-mRNA-splicing factor rse1 [Coemansia sp. RSA 485]KAJ2602724.1 pre-mRNA-splicing factor rse1 [Coemansia sp. RSA 1722]